MTPELFKYLLMAAYAVAVLWLSWIGMRRTRDLRGFSIGNRDMSPITVGITLAASISSTATFVINPGFVYVHGVSAWLHYGVAASLGILSAFLVLSRGFLRHGERQGALTIPQWIHHRYGSRAFSLFFALINLLSISFVVLILVGCSLLLSGLFPVSQQVALVPMLLVRGALSDLLSVETVARMKARKPDLETVDVPRRGHAPILDEPEALAAIKDFLARNA